jgi:hypothetical protein
VYGSALAGPGVVFFQVLTYALVIGALGMIVHALTRTVASGRAWTRYVWVALGAAWVMAFVFALIWRNDTTLTVVGIGFVVILVTEVAYVLRVVFPARQSSPTAVPEPTPEEQSPNA